MRPPAPALLGMVALLGCGTASPVDPPTLQLPFTSSPTAPVPINGSAGVKVGSEGYLAIGLLNVGNQPLVVQSVAYQGDPEITLDPGLGAALPATVEFNEVLPVELTCTPAAATTYAGTLTIVSNATSTPTAAVYLACAGTP